MFHDRNTNDSTDVLKYTVKKLQFRRKYVCTNVIGAISDCPCRTNEDSTDSVDAEINDTEIQAIKRKEEEDTGITVDLLPKKTSKWI